MTAAERQLTDYRLIQEDYANDPWKILVSAILVRRCRGTVAKVVARELFRRYPTPEDYSLFADSTEVFELLKPLGFGSVRTKAMGKLTEAYLELSNAYDFDQILSLPEVGNYALESYGIFVLGMRDLHPEDLMLQYYLRREGHLSMEKEKA